MTTPESPLPTHPSPHRGWGSGTSVWLVRHAEVHADWKGKAYGDLDVPLSDEGEARTAELALAFGALPLAAVLCSPLGRARELGRATAERARLAADEDEGLREVHRGSWQGLRVDELHERFPEQVDAFYDDPWSWDGHGGENDAAIARRAWRALERGIEEARGGTLLVATHYNVIRVLVAGALGIPPVRSFSFRIDTGRAALLVDGEDGWRLERSNVCSPPTEEDAA